MKRKQRTPGSFRFSAVAAGLLRRVADDTGETKTAVLERLIRREARRLLVRVASVSNRKET